MWLLFFIGPKKDRSKSASSIEHHGYQNLTLCIINQNPMFKWQCHIYMWDPRANGRYKIDARDNGRVIPSVTLVSASHVLGQLLSDTGGIHKRK